jgi:hypothetical protein
MERRQKQVLGIIGIVFVVGFLVVAPRFIGEYLGISPIHAAFGLIVLYFIADKLWNSRDRIS